MKKYYKIIGLKKTIYIIFALNLLLLYLIKGNITTCEHSLQSVNSFFKRVYLNYIDFVCLGFNLINMALIVFNIILIDLKLKEEMRVTVLVRNKTWNRVIKNLLFYSFGTSAFLSLSGTLCLCVTGVIFYGDKVNWGSGRGYADLAFGEEYFVDIGMNFPKIFLLVLVENLLILLISQSLYILCYFFKIKIVCPIIYFGLMALEKGKRFDGIKIFFNYIGINYAELYAGRINLVTCVLYPVAVYLVLLACILIFSKKRILI